MQRRRLAASFAADIAGRIFGAKVPPSLERSPRLRLRRNQLRREHDRAPADAVSAGDAFDTGDFLPHQHSAPHHPVERSAIEQFVRTPRRHSRNVFMQSPPAPLPATRDAGYHPRLQIIKTVSPRRQFNQMKRHQAGASPALVRNAQPRDLPRPLAFQVMPRGALNEDI